MDWYYVWWRWLTSKRVAQVCQHQLSFLLTTVIAGNALIILETKVHETQTLPLTGQIAGSDSRAYNTHTAQSVRPSEKRHKDRLSLLYNYVILRFFCNFYFLAPRYCFNVLLTGWWEARQNYPITELRRIAADM